MTQSNNDTQCCPATELLLHMTDKSSPFHAVDANLEPIHDTLSSEKNPVSESSSAINTDTVTPQTTQKQRATKTSSVIREKNKNTEKNEHEFIILSEELEEVDEEEEQIMLLPPDNT